MSLISETRLRTLSANQSAQRYDDTLRRPRASAPSDPARWSSATRVVSNIISSSFSDDVNPYNWLHVLLRLLNSPQNQTSQFILPCASPPNEWIQSHILRHDGVEAHPRYVPQLFKFDTYGLACHQRTCYGDTLYSGKCYNDIWFSVIIISANWCPLLDISLLEKKKY